MNKFGKIWVFATLLLTVTIVSGQGRPGMDKIKSLKVAFITERVGLTSNEATMFWPVYNEHEEALAQIRRKERMDIRSKMMDFENLSDSDANKLLDQLIELEKQKQELNVEFLSNIREVISPKKTFLLIKAEEDFKKRLLRQIQQRRQGGG
ncbi:hypothetical protein [Eudoraea adriatica]|uniref:hypothetical protein n=1 Tax=Eudoraea adriatica TaxID=446681 RepID=UPI00036C4BD9|nr:hypothetical protein [Eudoraea adriatica]